MKKDDGIIKKTQETLHDKVVPAAKEGFDKGTSYLSGLLKDTGKKAGELVEAAGEKTRDAGKALSKRSDKVLPNKNDAFKHFRKEAESVGQKAVRLKDNVSREAKDRAGSAVEFAKSKTQRVSKDVSKKADKASKEVAKKSSEVSEEATKATGGKKKRGKVVKTAAGVVVLAAAAAAAYAIYKKRQAEDEAIKAEFSEKMKKWNELEGEDLANAKDEQPVKMKVRPSRVYLLNQNALLGDDIVVSIAEQGDGMAEFNPDDVAEPVNTMEEFRRKAQDLASKTGDKARQVAGNVGDKAKEVYHTASDKAVELKDQFNDKLNDKPTESLSRDQSFGAKDIPMFRDEGRDTWQPVEGIAHEARDLSEDLAENTTEDAWRVEEELREVSRHTDKDVTDESLPEEDLEENQMAAPDDDDTPVDDLWEKEDLPADGSLTSNDLDPKGENVPWEDESLIMQRTEDIRRKGAQGYQVVKEKVTEAKDFVVHKYNEMKPEEEVETEDDFFIEEYQVTIHNRGNKDYFFSPMLIQRYNSEKRVTSPVPVHEEGTTLEQRIIKPGETYTGTLLIKMTIWDDALIMFEDMLMKNSVAVLLEEELDDQFLIDESLDLHDEYLFDGIEGDLEDYEFSDEELTALDLDDLDIEEAEELDFDYSEEDEKE